MDWLIKTLSLIIFALLGGLVFSLTAHLLIASGAMATAADTVNNFALDMTEKAVITWFISVVIAIGSLFIQSKWRYVLTLLPLYIPSIFAVIYTLMAA